MRPEASMLSKPPSRGIPPCAVGCDLSELEIRTAVIQSLACGAVVLEEFSSAGGRLDLLAVCDETLAGFEIKSDFDSLQRVDAQLAAFSQYCDTLTFVAGRRFALPLLRSLPVWCGVSLAYRTTARRVVLLPLRHPRENPLMSVDASLSLLRWHELAAIASPDVQTRMRRRELQEKLLTKYSFGELRTCLSTALMLRERNRFDELRTLNDGLCPPEANSPGLPCEVFDAT